MKIKALIEILNQKIKEFSKGSIVETKGGYNGRQFDESLQNLQSLFDSILIGKDFSHLINALKEKGEEEATPENLAPIINVFKLRWDSIRRGDKSYVSAPHYVTNQLYIGLAEIIAPILKVGVKSLLMPSLTMTKDELTGEDFNDPKFSFREFILSDDETRVIQVLPRIKSSFEEGSEVKTATPSSETKDSPAKMKSLSQGEKERLFNHSEEAREYHQVLLEVRKSEEEQRKTLTVGGFIDRFANGLYEGSKEGKGSGRGSEVQAGKAAFEAIETFKQFLETLKSSQKRVLFTLKSNAITTNFRAFWEALNEQGYYQSAVDRCTLEISKKLKILNTENEWPYTTWPANLDAAKKLYGEEKYQKETEALKLLNQNKIEQAAKKFEAAVRLKRNLPLQQQVQYNEAEFADQVAAVIPVIASYTLEEKKAFLLSICNCMCENYFDRNPIHLYSTFFLSRIRYRALEGGITLRSKFIQTLGYECLIPFVPNTFEQGDRVSVIKSLIRYIVVPSDFVSFFQRYPWMVDWNVIESVLTSLDINFVEKNYTLNLLKGIGQNNLLNALGLLEQTIKNSEKVFQKAKFLLKHLEFEEKIALVKLLGKEFLLHLFDQGKMNELLVELTRELTENPYENHRNRDFRYSDIYFKIQLAEVDIRKAEMKYLGVISAYLKSKPKIKAKKLEEFATKIKIQAIDNLLSQEDPAKFIAYLKQFCKAEKLEPKFNAEEKEEQTLLETEKPEKSYFRISDNPYSLFYSGRANRQDQYVDIQGRRTSVSQSLNQAAQNAGQQFRDLMQQHQRGFSHPSFRP